MRCPMSFYDASNRELFEEGVGFAADAGWKIVGGFGVDSAEAVRWKEFRRGADTIDDTTDFEVAVARRCVDEYGARSNGGEDVREVIECDLKLERAAHPDLKAAIVDCEAAGDYVSRELFEDILESEEEHIDWLETQLQLIERVGLPNYCQSQMESAS